MKIGLVGLGHLGEIHLSQWLEFIPREFLICFDTDTAKLDKIANKYSVQKATSYKQLLFAADIVDIVTPTQFHFELAEVALRANKHVFIEKPVCETEEQVRRLIKLQIESKTLVQIGHVERYNPAFMAVEEQIINPKFFEVHRLAPFVSRGTEVSVIMDLMIHDIDIIMHLVNSEVKNIYANGVSIVSQTPDIANVRIEFENGCVANLTASRISMKKMRKMRVFSDLGYVAIDFLEKNAECFHIMDAKENIEGLSFVNKDGIEKKLLYKEYKKMDNNAILQELQDFYNKIITRDINTKISLLSSLNVLKTAIYIQSEINKI